jgi:hypothetical protein
VFTFRHIFDRNGIGENAQGIGELLCSRLLADESLKIRHRILNSSELSGLIPTVRLVECLCQVLRSCARESTLHADMQPGMFLY